MRAQSLNPSSRRLYILAAVLFAAAIAILIRLYYWQIVRHDELSQLRFASRDVTIPLLARRGDIFTSDGVLLATDIYQYEITAHPVDITDDSYRAIVATGLAKALKRDKNELYKLLSGDARTVMVDRAAPSSVGPALRDLAAQGNLGGVEFVAKPSRTYPNKSLASHVVGFVTASRTGAYGVEQNYNDLLAGRPGQSSGGSNALTMEILWFNRENDVPPVDGSALVLTIDSGMQNLVERELARGIKDSGSTGGQIVILDAQTSAILAMASMPEPDLNAYSTTNLKEYENPAVSMVYEPGSVFKVVTLAAGLDSGKITAASTFNDTGSVVVGGQAFHNHDYIHPGFVTLIDVMKQSLNVEACKISTSTGTKLFYQYVHDFGYGNSSGVDLAGEVPGSVKTPGDGQWYESDLCSNAFGQGIAVTTLQMANALATVANGGKLMRPYIVSKIVQPDGTVTPRNPSMIRQVIKPETARLVTDILAQAVGTESINQAVVPGYRIAGKTGTASIPVPGGYDPKWTIASFGGYFPVDNPRYVIMVRLDRPSVSQWGSVVASPVFKRVAEQVVQLTGLPPDDVRAKSSAP